VPSTLNDSSIDTDHITREQGTDEREVPNNKTLRLLSEYLKNALWLDYSPRQRQGLAMSGCTTCIFKGVECDGDQPCGTCRAIASEHHTRARCAHGDIFWEDTIGRSEYPRELCHASSGGGESKSHTVFCMPAGGRGGNKGPKDLPDARMWGAFWRCLDCRSDKNTNSREVMVPYFNICAMCAEIQTMRQEQAVEAKDPEMKAEAYNPKGRPLPTCGQYGHNLVLMFRVDPSLFFPAEMWHVSGGSSLY